MYKVEEKCNDLTTLSYGNTDQQIHMLVTNSARLDYPKAALSYIKRFRKNISAPKVKSEGLL